MKALTIWQPWASLVVCEAKKIVTLPWETSYRGPIAIRAAKIIPSSILQEKIHLSEINRFLDAISYEFEAYAAIEDIYDFY